MPFLKLIQETVRARNVSEEQLFQCASELFVGEARSFFRSVRYSAGTWRELIWSLRLNLLRPSYNGILFAEIKRRAQGEDEKVVIYLATSENYFNKILLPPPLPQILKIITNDLLPYLQERMSLMESQLWSC